MVIKLEGGRGSAKAAAAVTQLPSRLDDSQLGLSRAVRRAQRNHRDLTEERGEEKYIHIRNVSMHYQEGIKDWQKGATARSTDEMQKL